jgi:hypothetical protein
MSDIETFLLGRLYQHAQERVHEYLPNRVVSSMPASVTSRMLGSESSTSGNPIPIKNNVFSRPLYEGDIPRCKWLCGLSEYA